MSYMLVFFTSDDVTPQHIVDLNQKAGEGTNEMTGDTSQSVRHHFVSARHSPQSSGSNEQPNSRGRQPDRHVEVFDKHSDFAALTKQESNTWIASDTYCVVDARDIQDETVQFHWETDLGSPGIEEPVDLHWKTFKLRWKHVGMALIITQEALESAVCTFNDPNPSRFINEHGILDLEYAFETITKESRQRSSG